MADKSNARLIKEMKELVDLSEQITRLAAQNNWAQVNTLSLQREQRLALFFSGEIPDNIRIQVIEAIGKIRMSDEETVRLVKNNRDELGREILDLRAHKERIKKYISNQH